MIQIKRRIFRNPSFVMHKKRPFRRETKQSFYYLIMELTHNNFNFVNTVSRSRDNVSVYCLTVNSH